MQKLHDSFSLRSTPQSQPMRDDQIKNRAGGYVFRLDPWKQLDRFLALGTSGGTYYATERELSTENAQVVMQLLKEDGLRVVSRIITLSEGGKIYKNDAALFALALAITAGDVTTRRAAAETLPHVARIPTHLFTFLEYVKHQRGWGRVLRRAVAEWYNNRPLDRLIYQATKYQQRGGWSHRDALRIAHPKATGQRDAFYGYLAKGEIAPEQMTPYLGAVLQAAKATSAREVANLIRDHALPREVIPTEYLNTVEVWEALLEDMPMTAMIRNLATMTRIGLLKPLSPAVGYVVSRLRDREVLRKARIHPLQVLAALTTYSAGVGARGSHSWTPVPQITDALNEAFYFSFENVEPTNKRIMLALDVSGSMGWGEISGIPGLTPAMGAAAMAMTIARTEPNYAVMGFANTFRPLPISPSQRLDDVLRTTRGLTFGRTDCAQPMIYAQQEGLGVDAFIVITDNETWAGGSHPAQALRRYREKTGIPAKLLVIGMTATDCSIADPNDAGMLDIAGFTTDVPSVIADFITD